MILFVCFVTGVMLLTTSSVSNDKAVSDGGRFAGDHYINEEAGVNIDLSDRWVYFDAASAKNALNDQGARQIQNFYFENEGMTRLMSASRPGMTIAVFKAENRFERQFLTTEMMYSLAHSTEETLNNNGYKAEYKVHYHGRINQTRNVFYYVVTCSSPVFTGDLLYAYLNAQDKGIMILVSMENDDDIQSAKDFILDNIKIIGEQPQQ